MATSNETDTQARDTNPDPITGAPGSHPVGTGIGAAGGGAAGAAAGAAIGSVVPGIGTVIGGVVGAVVGAVGGGLAGKGVAEAVDPTGEDAYWRENHKSRPYVEQGKDYSHYAPAYWHGVASRQKYPGKDFDEAEADLRGDWEREHGASGMGWDKARPAAKDAWERVGQSPAGAQAQEVRAGTEATLPVVEEQIQVGKREVERGGVRVQSRVEERPVEARVNLREEHARVERRPVDRQATEADFTRHAGTVEVTERAEVPVVAKEARVVEEVVVGTEATERTETVRDTVRRTDVEVEQAGQAGQADATSREARRTDTKR